MKNPVLVVHRPPLSPLEHAGAFLVLGLLVLFSIANFFQFPYIGFDWNGQAGLVIAVFDPPPEPTLIVDDELLQVGDTAMADFQTNLYAPLFPRAPQPGETLTIRVRRGDQTLDLRWRLPGFTWDEFWYRLTSQWWLAFVFWGFGELTLLTLRPRDTRWRLLVVFNLITALWLGASAVSRLHLWGSAVVLRAAIWLSVPVYWHLHWVTPRPLRRLPAWLASAGYALFGLLAVSEFFGLLPLNVYALGLLLAFAGSLLLLLAHLFWQRAQRAEAGFLLIAGALAFVPPLALSFVQVRFRQVNLTSAAALMFLTVLPTGYFYAAARRQLRGLELRVNHLLALYLFGLGLVAVLIVGLGVADLALSFQPETLLVALVASAATGLFIRLAFSPFERFIQRRLLRIRLLPAELVRAYAARITVSPSRATLVAVIRGEILPSLLVRQSALLQWDTLASQPVVVYAAGVDAADLPGPETIRALLSEAGVYRPPAAAASDQPCAWVRVALPLTLQREPVGVWLLGRRDPDDFYAQSEIEVLETLAAQTSVALTNLVQAEHLRALYRADVDRGEAERTGLARELHDNALNQLAALKTNLDANVVPPSAFTLLDTLIGSLREMVTGLRPATLGLGLGPALVSLVDHWEARSAGSVSLACGLQPDGARYDPLLELHIYRIVQQAGENALRHARARQITLRGQLEPQLIDVTLEDDGQGFVTDARMDLAALLAHRQFGMAGMLERAALVGAQVHIDSALGRGTRVRVVWRGGDDARQPD